MEMFPARQMRGLKYQEKNLHALQVLGVGAENHGTRKRLHVQR